MQKLLDLYKGWSGSEPSGVERLDAAGSNRQYFRIIGVDGGSVIGVIGTSRDEDHAFIYLSKHFRQRQLPVPRILAVADDELRYIAQKERSRRQSLNKFIDSLPYAIAGCDYLESNPPLTCVL